MIENQWYAVLESREVRTGRPFGAVRFSRKLVFWRNTKNEICCVENRCCHRGAGLLRGKVRGDYLMCPFHGFEYDRTGKVVRIPANGRDREVPERYRIRSYPAREAYGFIFVWYGNDAEELPEIPFFEDLRKGFSFGSISEVWSVHYTRAIENQLDVVHLPFVHGTTIGRGGKTLVNGPVVRWQGNRMTFYVDNEKDRGQEPKKPGEIADYEKLYCLQLQMPNLWQNVISDRVRIMAAFAPVDGTHTRIYIRFYQSFVRLPLLREIVNGLGNIADRIVLHQDRRVVLTQEPKKSELLMDEKLIQGDLPIIEYRRRREQLKKPAIS